MISVIFPFVPSVQRTEQMRRLSQSNHRCVELPNVVVLLDPREGQDVFVRVCVCLDSLYDGRPLAVFSNHTSVSYCALPIVDDHLCLSLKIRSIVAIIEHLSTSHQIYPENRLIEAMRSTRR